jgi:hypothetical protein
MSDSDFTAAEWLELEAALRMGTASAEEGPPSPEEIRLLFDAAAQLPPEKLRILIQAIRAAVEH